MKSTTKATDKRRAKPAPRKARADKAAPARPEASKSHAKSKGLAAIDELLAKQGAPRGEPAGKAPETVSAPGSKARVGASAAPPPRRPVPSASPPSAAVAVPTPDASRFERSVARAAKGEPGPIRLADLTLDPGAVQHAHALGRVELYTKILRGNPSAQPGRPLVNVVGSGDDDLAFHLLSLHELVLAAQALGRDVVQVMLVRLTDAEADELLATPAPPLAAPVEARPLTPRQIAAMNGFLELPLSAIVRTENLRQAIDQTSGEFHNLVESIRTIGLQNPPVVEVREPEDLADLPLYVCVSGHRRLLALETLGVTETTCALKTFTSERHRALAGLAENINREDLHFLDKADGYGLLMRQGMTATEIAALLDADVRTVGKYLRASTWDAAVKSRVRELGGQATTRFLLNMLAAGERTTPELNAMIDRFVTAKAAPVKPARGLELRKKLGDFYALSDVTHEQRAVVEKALRFLGFLS